MQISAQAHQLMAAVEAGHSFEEIGRQVSHAWGRTVSAAEAEAAYQTLVERIEAIESTPRSGRQGSLWLSVKLLPQSWVARTAGFLEPLLDRRIALFIIPTALLVVIWAWSQKTALSVDQSAFLVSFALFVASVVIHELGHASACSRYGCRPGEIGIGLYFAFPVMYSDVTDVWRLRRWQRVVVDVGGVYFQLIVAALYGVAFLVTGWPVLKLAMNFVLFGILFSLNPILRFDGYWILSDALGVPNLGTQTVHLVRRWWNRLRGMPQAPLPWSPIVAWGVKSYVTLRILILAVIVCVILPQAVWNLRGFSETVEQFQVQLSNGTLGAAEIMAAVKMTIFLLFIAYLLMVLGRRLAGFFGRQLQEKA
jgi:putative peptide zinc metalloprotease protein